MKISCVQCVFVGTWLREGSVGRSKQVAGCCYSRLTIVAVIRVIGGCSIFGQVFAPMFWSC